LSYTIISKAHILFISKPLKEKKRDLNVLKLGKSQNLSQEQLAHKSGLHRTHIGMREQRKILDY
jgi:transcriptional regulator with XRE-family HTH domain